MAISFCGGSPGLKLYVIRAGHFNLDLQKIKEEILADRKPPEPVFQPEPGREDADEWPEEAGHAA